MFNIYTSIFFLITYKVLVYLNILNRKPKIFRLQQDEPMRGIPKYTEYKPKELN